ISMEPAHNQDNWVESIKPVITPMSPQELGFTYVDAQDYIDGLIEIDSPDGEELIKLSNFHQFQDQLDKFIENKGLIGRIITPLNMVQTYSNQIINQLTSETEEVAKLQELLRQKQFIIVESRKRLERMVLGEVHDLTSSIIKKGHEMVSLITPSVKQ